MLTRSIAGTVLGLGLLALSLGACQVIAGIEERKLDPAIAEGKQCSEYCTKVMDICTGEDAVYPNRDQCLGFCGKLLPGDDQEIERVNSVACRIHVLDSAELEASDCKAAGPGGNGICGTDCDAYCTVYPVVCPDDFDYGDKAGCLKACSGLVEQDRYNLTDDHEGDTIECRLVHTSSATVLPAEHCPHATIVPAEPWCTGKADATPTCESYCKIELAACTGALQQYETEPQCVAACSAFDIGTNGDEAGNTVGCRSTPRWCPKRIATTRVPAATAIAATPRPATATPTAPWSPRLAPTTSPRASSRPPSASRLASSSLPTKLGPTRSTR
jgi:hypothetical protein